MLGAGFLALRMIGLSLDQVVGYVVHQLDQPGAHAERERYGQEMEPAAHDLGRIRIHSNRRKPAMPGWAGPSRQLGLLPPTLPIQVGRPAETGHEPLCTKPHEVSPAREWGAGRQQPSLHPTGHAY